MVAIRKQGTEKMESVSYGELLKQFLPTVINTEKENEMTLAKLDRLISKGEENWGNPEARIFELLSFLVEQFEEKAYPIGLP